MPDDTPDADTAPDAPPALPTLYAVWHAAVGTDTSGPTLQSIHATEAGACALLDALLDGEECELLESEQAVWMGAHPDRLLDGSAWGDFEGEPWAAWISTIDVQA